MDNPSQASSGSKRPGSRACGRLMSGLAATLCTALTVGLIYFSSALQNSLCPSSTFQSWWLPAGVGFTLGGIMTLFPSVPILAIGLWMKFGSGRTNATMIIWPALIVVLCAAISAEGAGQYFCLSPTAIVLRPGYPGKPHTLTWNDLTGVRAWCSILSIRGRTPEQVGTLTLLFSDGTHLPFGLMNGRQFLTQNYIQIRKILAGKSYKYDFDPTVNPKLCPPWLYPLLRDWQHN